MNGNDNYCKMYYFMMGEGLMLSGIDLMVYIFIFNFWANGKAFYSSCQSLAQIIGSNRFTINRSIQSLLNQGYIKRLDEKTRYGAYTYTINEEVLFEKFDNWNEIKDKHGFCQEDEECEIVTGRCDEKSQVGVTKNHTLVCEKVIGRCDKKSHNYNNDNNKDIKSVKIFPPLPPSCREDRECNRLWEEICKREKWITRDYNSIVMSLKKIDGLPIDVVRLMMEYTIEKDKDTFYEPNQAMLEKARSLRCAEKSHLSPPEKNDKEVLCRLHQYFPHDLKEEIYNGGSEKRELHFFEEDGMVIISCTESVKHWIISISDTVNNILKGWVSQPYKGFSFKETTPGKIQVIPPSSIHQETSRL